MQTIEGHPLVGSPYVNVLATINIIIINDTKQNNKPNTDEKISGVVEKAVIPSNAYLNNFQKDHLVSPATLSTFSYSIHFVLKPTKLNKPLEYLLYSLIEIMLSTICLVINL